MFDEVIVCSKCKGKDCRVEELRELEELSMEEYARRRAVRSYEIFMSRLYQDTARRFLITCQDCGHQHEFTERAEKPPIVTFNDGDQ